MVSKSVIAVAVAVIVVAVVGLVVLNPLGDDGRGVSDPTLRTDVRVGDSIVFEATTSVSDEFENARAEYVVLEASQERISVRETITDLDSGRQSESIRTFTTADEFLEGVYARAPMDTVRENFEMTGHMVLSTHFGDVQCDMWRSVTAASPFDVWLSSEGIIYRMEGEGFEIHLVSSSLLS